MTALAEINLDALDVDVARDFSDTPGGRYRRHGPHSGEEFRQSVLLPLMKKAIQEGKPLHVRIDNVKRSYQSSFLEEALAGLIRAGVPANDVLRLLVVDEARLPRFAKYVTLARDYISKAAKGA